MTWERALARAKLYRLFESLLISEASRREIFDRFVGARPGDRVLDLGCGPGAALGYLPRVEYVGIDISAAYIDAARARFPGEELICGSFEIARELPGPFDRVLAIGVLHHLTDEQAADLMRISHDLLAPGGMLMAIDGCLRDGQPRFARFMLARDRGAYVRDRAGYLALAEPAFARVVVTERDDLLRIPYSHLILQAYRE